MLRPLISRLEKSGEGNLSNEPARLAGDDTGGRTVAGVPLLKVVERLGGGGLGGLNHCESP